MTSIAVPINLIQMLYSTLLFLFLLSIGVPQSDDRELLLSLQVWTLLSVLLIGSGCKGNVGTNQRIDVQKHY